MAPLANPKHEAFCRAIVAGCSVAEAFRRAGYAHDPSGHNQLRVSEEDSVKTRIAEMQARKAARAEVDAAWVLTKLKRIATRAPKLSDRNKALEMIAKHLGLFEHVKKIEHSGTIKNEHLDMSPLTPQEAASFADLYDKAQRGKRTD